MAVVKGMSAEDDKMLKALGLEVYLQIKTREEIITMQHGLDPMPGILRDIREEIKKLREILEASQVSKVPEPATPALSARPATSGSGATFTGRRPSTDGS